ncbi:MAG TPA: hypothetical protein ENN67_07180 [Firmicutes bacterium]|nr:hypothetical protein [Bacillota bacterium]
MYNPRTGIWAVLITGFILTTALGCAGGSADNPVLPHEGAGPAITSGTESVNSPLTAPKNSEVWGFYYMVINEADMSVEVIPNRTLADHYDVTWVKDICPNCVTVKLKNFDSNTRTFYLELHTHNPTFKTGYDVRFIVDLDGTGEYDLLNPNNYTRLFDAEGLPNPFLALSTYSPSRAFYPKQNDVANMTLYISETHSPLAYIPFIIEASWPGRCLEPYEIKDIKVIGEFPPGGGGSVTVECTVNDSQSDHGEVWLRTGGIFTSDDILMTPGASVGTHGRKFSATFANALGGGSGLTRILIEAYNEDTVAEPYPMNDYARIFADPGGASAIAGDVFDALNKMSLTSVPYQTTVNINNTSGGGSPLPYQVNDGTYFVTVQAGNYAMNVTNSNYQKQDTLYDVVVPPDTTVLVCFGMAPKWLTTPGDGIATISGVCKNSNTLDPIQGVGLTLDGGPALGGIIQSRVSDSRGHYCFYAVPTEKQPIYKVNAFHPDYLPKSIENVNSGKNKSTPQIDFLLVPTGATHVWREDFETGPSNVGTKQDWFFSRVASQSWPGGDGSSNYHNQTVSGDILWRVTDPTSPPVQCTFYANGICTLPPDDTSEGWMPEAYEGHRYMWYGEELDDTPPSSPHGGSFIDEWNGTTSPGGTSSNGANAGVARTGPINLTGHSELTLTLQTWWEIESVDPSIMFDAMDILISTDNNYWTRLDRLNPLSEPIPDDSGQNAPKPYTSAGFFQAAIWSALVFDISSYGGNSTVYLRFDFDTRDGLYNGFRSWVVDDITIWPYKID